MVSKKKVVKDKTGKAVSCDIKSSCKSGCGGCAYFLGFLGAAIYYINTATGFWNGVLGILKALVWPAFLVFELLKFLAM
jgi:hypothetical protein